MPICIADEFVNRWLFFGHLDWHTMIFAMKLYSGIVSESLLDSVETGKELQNRSRRREMTT